jgi:Cdc6-like AAA superfamily ATPase
MRTSKKNLNTFHSAALSLKLFSRAELSDEKNRSLIEKLYVDPLPNDQVFKTLLAANTTIIMGRKGTGKSTVFQRVQHEIRKNKLSSISAYMDIRNVFEESQVDPAAIEKVGALEGAMTPSEIKKLLLHKRFIKKLLSEIREELLSQTERNFLTKLRENMIGSSKEAFAGLDKIIRRLDSPNYEDIALYLKGQSTSASGMQSNSSASAQVSANIGITSADISSDVSAATAVTSTASKEETYSQILMRVVGVSDIIEQIQKLLHSIGMKNLYIFLDDFSELPNDAMHLVVDSLISPLSRWSEFIKFKIAAYPGRLYLGALDSTKIEVINLDIYGLYGGSGVAQMEEILLED